MSSSGGSSGGFGASGPGYITSSYGSTSSQSYLSPSASQPSYGYGTVLDMGGSLGPVYFDFTPLLAQSSYEERPSSMPTSQQTQRFLGRGEPQYAIDYETGRTYDISNPGEPVLLSPGIFKPSTPLGTTGATVSDVPSSSTDLTRRLIFSGGSVAEVEEGRRSSLSSGGSIDYKRVGLTPGFTQASVDYLNAMQEYRRLEPLVKGYEEASKEVSDLLKNYEAKEKELEAYSPFIKSKSEILSEIRDPIQRGQVMASLREVGGDYLFIGDEKTYSEYRRKVEELETLRRVLQDKADSLSSTHSELKEKLADIESTLGATKLYRGIVTVLGTTPLFFLPSTYPLATAGVVGSTALGWKQMDWGERAMSSLFSAAALAGLGSLAYGTALRRFSPASWEARVLQSQQKAMESVLKYWEAPNPPKVDIAQIYKASGYDTGALPTPIKATLVSPKGGEIPVTVVARAGKEAGVEYFKTLEFPDISMPRAALTGPKGSILGEGGALKTELQPPVYAWEKGLYREFPTGRVFIAPSEGVEQAARHGYSFEFRFDPWSTLTAREQLQKAGLVYDPLEKIAKSYSAYIPQLQSGPFFPLRSAQSTRGVRPFTLEELFQIERGAIYPGATKHPWSGWIEAYSDYAPLAPLGRRGGVLGTLPLAEPLVFRGPLGETVTLPEVSEIGTSSSPSYVEPMIGPRMFIGKDFPELWVGVPIPGTFGPSKPLAHYPVRVGGSTPPTVDFPNKPFEFSEGYRVLSEVFLGSKQSFPQNLQKWFDYWNPLTGKAWRTEVSRVGGSVYYGRLKELLREASETPVFKEGIPVYGDFGTGVLKTAGEVPPMIQVWPIQEPIRFGGGYLPVLPKSFPTTSSASVVSSPAYTYSLVNAVSPQRLLGSLVVGRAVPEIGPETVMPTISPMRTASPTTVVANPVVSTTATPIIKATPETIPSIMPGIFSSPYPGTVSGARSDLGVEEVAKIGLAPLVGAFPRPSIVSRASVPPGAEVSPPFLPPSIPFVPQPPVTVPPVVPPPPILPPTFKVIPAAVPLPGLGGSSGGTGPTSVPQGRGPLSSWNIAGVYIVAPHPMPGRGIVKGWIGRKTFKYGAVTPRLSKITGAALKTTRGVIYVPVVSV